MKKYYPLPEEVYPLLSVGNTVLLDTSRFDEENTRSYLFMDPVDILQINTLQEIPGLFRMIEANAEKGYFLAGYFSYEAGYHFEQLFRHKCPTLEYPLAWFGVYEKPSIYDHCTGQWDNPPTRGTLPHSQRQAEGRAGIAGLEFGGLPGVSGRHEYTANIERIKEHIGSGEVYQVNFTDRFNFAFSGSPEVLYRELKRRQTVAYSAMIRTENEAILSFSPELFFTLNGDLIKTKPMKGTAARGRTASEDDRVADGLHNDEKSRAENLMIVDLLRNDLGRIAEIGSVKVPKLFSLEKYETLWQMTSTIEGTLKSGIDFYHLFKALFPCGSVTGAPKISAMRIIDALEKKPRGIYTGSIGYFAPKRTASFNVAIRTMVIRDGKGEMGSGSGIVWDSRPEAEYEECLLKADFLTSQEDDFYLIETLLWDGKYRLFEKHLQRLTGSAEYFGIPLDKVTVLKELNLYSRGLMAGDQYKVRLTVDRMGSIIITHFPATFEESIKVGTVELADVQIDSSDRFLYHKTSRRGLYDRAYQKARHAGRWDCIFRNERGDITEGAISNVFIKKDALFYTPPVECGLLNGVYRQLLLETLPVEEQVLTIEDLLGADEVYITNAVRGLRQVKLKIDAHNE